MSYAAICASSGLSRRIYAEVKRGDTKSLYAYYAVFRIYLNALLERGDHELLLTVLRALHEALEEDFKTRHRL